MIDVAQRNNQKLAHDGTETEPQSIPNQYQPMPTLGYASVSAASVDEEFQFVEPVGGGRYNPNLLNVNGERLRGHCKF